MLTIVSRLFLVVIVSVVLPARAEHGDGRDRAKVRPLLGFDRTSDGPFPSDRFTVPDPAQNTCLRVNLPRPASCAGQESECIELDFLNELDGFNLKPRLSVPFSGQSIPAP